MRPLLLWQWLLMWEQPNKLSPSDYKTKHETLMVLNKKRLRRTFIYFFFLQMDVDFHTLMFLP